MDERLVEGVVDRQEARRALPGQRCGHRRPGTAQQNAAVGPAAAGSVRDGGKHADAHRIDRRHPGQVADDRVGLLGQVLQQATLDLGCCGEVEVTDQPHHDAVIASRVLDVHGRASWRESRDWSRLAAG
ncbi:MAG TPA: hypothetical protein VNT24_01665 [Propionibacteriaceae bacterium]|nr:hypothetical protein [Propionibacteriaceae bacterium]